jgi:hypothetical protein
MGNTVAYSDPRFGVEKVIISPLVSDMSSNEGSVSSVYFTEDITITEIFAIVSEALSVAGVSGRVALYEGSVKLAEILLPTGLAAGTLVRGATAGTDVLSANEISNGDTLSFYRSKSVPGTGTVYIGMKYTPRFVTP